MTLKIYRQKRDFKKTSEPAGSNKLSNKYKNIFVIQKHAASRLHYDFRLELNGVLLSWAVPKGPCLDPAVKRLAMHVEDHPVEYALFEGIIPSGEYGAGTVMLWDKGKWKSKDKNPNQAYQAGDLTFELHGEKLHGMWKLVRIKHEDKSWLLIKIADQYSKPFDEYDITKAKPYSVLTQQGMNAIASNYKHMWSKKGLVKTKSQTLAKNKQISLTEFNLEKNTSSMPNEIYPQLATLVDEPPEGENWLHEIKFDGYRLLAFKDGKNIRLMTRNNNDWTTQFKNIQSALKLLPSKNFIFDGEVVVLDENQHSNFQLLQNSIKSNEDKFFIYYLFDILYYDRYDLRNLPLIKRKNILEKILQQNTNEHLKYSDHVFGSGKEILDKSCNLGLEGIVSKDADSEYLQKRTTAWLKTKCTQRQEFIICGFTQPQGSRRYFGALLLGTYNKNKELIYNGNVGTGFTQASLKSVYEAIKKNITTQMPFAKKPPASNRVTWVKPVIVAEIEFSQWTDDEILRHPSFKGLRSDKPASAITKEKPIHVRQTSRHKGRKQNSSDIPIKITNPNKILYPEDKITKLEVAEYYANIQSWILPYIINRPLTIVRCPENYKKCFYQKHINKSTPPQLHGIEIKEKADIELSIYIENSDGLLALAQMGVLEIHPWGSQIENIEHPDVIVFDLDPATDVAWKKVVATAFKLKKLLADYQLKSFVKTTGGKGLHVVVPIKPEYNWEQVKIFAHAIVNYIMIQNPNEYVNKMTKSIRTGKIFLDYMRNNRGATAIAPYSTRAREHAPIAAPLAWEELSNNFKDTYYTIKTMPNRLAQLKHDPWKYFFKIKQSLRLDEL